MELSQLSNQQLINLFGGTSGQEVSPNGRAILMELMRRGCFFDVHQGDFLTRFEWKLRYRGDEPPTPADYLVYLQMHAKQPDEAP